MYGSSELTTLAKVTQRTEIPDGLRVQHLVLLCRVLYKGESVAVSLQPQLLMQQPRTQRHRLLKV